MTMNSALYIVATPIGNLSDMTARAVEILNYVDIVAAEDTRHSARLLSHYGIHTPLKPYHDHSDQNQIDRLLEMLNDGKNIALISDAGTPLISDPGYKLVTQARAMGLNVVPVPGPCALIAALSASGLPSDRFSFEGFLSAKRGARLNELEKLAVEVRTLIFYESPHRIVESLSDMAEIFGSDRELVIGREVSKAYETFLCGSFGEVLSKVIEDVNQQKGEMVVMVRGYQADGKALSTESRKLLSMLIEELPLKKAAGIVAEFCGEKKNQLYQYGLELKDS